MCSNGVMCDGKRDELKDLCFDMMKNLLIEMKSFNDLDNYDTEDIFELINRVDSHWEGVGKMLLDIVVNFIYVTLAVSWMITIMMTVLYFKYNIANYTVKTMQIAYIRSLSLTLAVIYFYHITQNI